MTPGSKAAKQGILIGDLLVSINNEPCDDMTHSNALNRVKKSGKDLILTLERYGPILFIKYLHPPPAHSQFLSMMWVQENWITFQVRRKKKYLWFRFHIVKKLGSVGRKYNFFLNIFFHGFGSFLLGNLQ